MSGCLLGLPFSFAISDVPIAATSIIYLCCVNDLSNDTYLDTRLAWISG